MHRRDFLNGVALSGAGFAWVPAAAAAGTYPPGLTGLRGSHPGAMDVAHNQAWNGQIDTQQPQGEPELYDLVVVGAGISGLSAAHFYRQRVKPDARILILDNHDDFGGHARRNEFEVDGRQLVAYGGTQSFDTPESYSRVAKGLLRDLGVDMVALRRAYDLDWFARHRLGLGLFCDQAGFARDMLLPGCPPSLRPAGYYGRHYVPGLVTAPQFADVLARLPLRTEQRAQVQRVLVNAPSGRSAGLRESDVRREESYLAFLGRVYGVTDPGVQALLSMVLAEDSALGGHAVSMAAATAGGLLGLGTATQRARWFADSLDDGEDALDEQPLPIQGDDEDLDGYLFHYPDGGATVARLLVHRLVPAVARFSDVAGCVAARFDYAQLDRPGQQPVNIRLSSTAVSVANLPDSSSERLSSGVDVRYVQSGRVRQALARHVVMAGWSAASAHVVKGLPPAQQAAMRANVKMPMLYAQVVLRRWQALQRAGMGAVYAPHAPFQFSQLDFPVRMGGVAPPARTDQPVCLLMVRCPGPLLSAADAPDLFKAGRAEMLGQDFAQHEQAVMQQLQAMFGPHGFDAQRDVAALTLNRWGHGYVWDESEHLGQPAHKLSARPVGNIAMAGADSTGRAYLDAAIDAAWRAVGELPRSQ